MRKDDDISGLELDGLSIRQLDDGSAVDDQMVEHQVRRPRSDAWPPSYSTRAPKSPREPRIQR